MKCTYNNYSELPLILNPIQVGEILSISRTGAYALCKSAGFPAILVGKQYRIPRDRFFQWLNSLDEQTVINCK